MQSQINIQKFKWLLKILELIVLFYTTTARLSYYTCSSGVAMNEYSQSTYFASLHLKFCELHIHIQCTLPENASLVGQLIIL